MSSIDDDERQNNIVLFRLKKNFVQLQSWIWYIFHSNESKFGMNKNFH